MISIPIWVFVMLVTLSSILVLAFIFCLIGYLQVCKLDKHDKEIHLGHNIK